jgi:D-arginine dehydrogenase
MIVDVAIVGGGMAGASLAAEIAPHRSVVILEAEAMPGRHATGRSAAFWTESYGGPGVQPLTTASGPWLAAPPPEFSTQGFLSPRRALHITDDPHGVVLERLRASFSGRAPVLDPVDRDEISRILPGVRAGWSRGLIEASTMDIDVAALHAAYLAGARRAGATLLCDARVERIDPGERWTIGTTAGEVRAGVLVNAAGAWADEVAVLAGVATIGIRAYRRTIVQLRIDPPPPATLPLVLDATGRFYFKPEAGGRLWLSPHDETPHPAGEAGAEEIDIALAIARLEQVVDWRVERVERSWAGLRSFAPDRLPVYGADARVPGFFWFAGQGGFGIQTAPAAAKLAAALLLGRDPEPMVAEIDPAPYAPERFG